MSARAAGGAGRGAGAARALPAEPSPAAPAAQAGAGPGSASGGALHAIGDLARQAEVSARTIRYYEEIGLLRTARRFAGGRRAYDADALERLRFIGRLKRLGLALEEIRHLNDVFAMQHSTAAMLRELERLLGRHLETIAERIRELSGLQREIGAYRERIRGRLKGAPPLTRAARGNGGNGGNGMAAVAVLKRKSRGARP